MDSVSQKPEQQAPPKNELAEPQTPVVTPIPVRKPSGRIAGVSLSINHTDLHPEFKNKELKPIDLTQEILDKLWAAMLSEKEDNMQLVGLLAGRKVVAESKDSFYLIAPNIFFEPEFQPFQTEVISYIRNRCHNQRLAFRIVVEMEQQKKMAYRPAEKYEEMLAINPALANLRELFQDIDY